MKTDFGLGQRRKLAENMDHWLNLFDDVLAHWEVPLFQRPLRAIRMLFEEGAVEVKAGNKPLGVSNNIYASIEESWFRILFDAVEYWYVERYGASAIEAKSNTSIKGVQMVRNEPFAMSIPTNRVVVEPGELAWMYFEDGLGEEEDATNWIVEGPELSKLEIAARANVVAEAKRTAEILRAIEFRRVMFPSSGDKEVYKLIQSTLLYLSQAADRMVAGRKEGIGPAWFDLQMANECALKAVILSSTEKQPHEHSLNELVKHVQRVGVIFETSQFEDWPTFSLISTWRYGQGSPEGIGRLYPAYQVSLKLAGACMSHFKPCMPGGFGLEIKYSPWRTQNALGEYRDL